MKFVARALWKLDWPPWLVSGLIGGLVFAIVVGLQQLGWLQYFEFPIYDLMLRHRPAAMVSDSRFCLIGITEDDIQSPGLDYPIWDEKMAQLMARIEAQQPRAIGLDIYRDIPVPKSGTGQAALNKVLLAYPNIICIWSPPGPSSAGIRPPAVLKDLPDRIGFNDFTTDFDGTVRRGTLIEDPDNIQSLALNVALAYLAREGIGLTADANGWPQLGKTVFKPFEANDGCYVRAHAGGYQFLDDFKGPREFQTYSLSQVFSNQIPADAFRDKIVLIGEKTDSVPDFHVTPISKRHLGIEVHALKINQLLRAALDGDRLVRVWPDGVEWGWTFLWCLAGAAVGLGVRSPWRSCALLAMLLAGLALMVWHAFLADWWLPAAMPAIACVADAGLVSWYVSDHEKRQRKLVMRLFGTQVSPEIAEAIWKQRNEFLVGGQPRPQRLIATVLFTDLKGFSTISEKLPPDKIMDWLNAYMSAMTRAVIDNKGVVEKFIGDSVMALFGVPVARTKPDEIKQDAINAVRAALAMERELERLNIAWQQDGLPETGMRVGIYTGEVVAGSVGSTERMEYTVLGDTVNTASRLESHDKDLVIPELAGRRCRILVGESTGELLAGQFRTRCVGTLHLKGKTEPVTIHVVVEKATPKTIVADVQHETSPTT